MSGYCCVTPAIRAPFARLNTSDGSAADSALTATATITFKSLMQSNGGLQ